MSDVELVPFRPHFDLDELRSLQKAMVDLSRFVGGVGFSARASGAYREYRHWKDRLDSLIAEYAEYEEES